MTLSPNDPKTWRNIAEHPAFEEKPFDPSWYDGEIDVDIRMLESAAIAILSHFPNYSCELIVLDDCTVYFEVTHQQSIVASVYPSDTDDYRRCYFVDIAGVNDEMRFETIDLMIEMLRTTSQLP